MKTRDAVTLGVAAAGIGLVAFLVFWAPEAPELDYAPVELTGTTMTADASAPYRVDAWVKLKKPGFVTVHESIGGAPGAIVATSMYLETDTVVTSIKIDPPLVPAASYIALLHVDNGDKTYVVEDDLPVMSDGVVLRADFTAPAE